MLDIIWVWAQVDNHILLGNWHTKYVKSSSQENKSDGLKWEEEHPTKSKYSFEMDRIRSPLSEIIDSVDVMFTVK